MDAPSSSPSSSSFSRPVSARGVPLSLGERVALYCHQSTAANNAGVLRSVPKPTADEISEFLTQRSHGGVALYDDTALVRLLLGDSDYDAVCRDVLSLQDAIVWHAKQDPDRTHQRSTSTLPMLLMSAPHVFTEKEICAAHALATSLGMDDVLGLFPELVSFGNDHTDETGGERDHPFECVNAKTATDDHQQNGVRIADLSDNAVKLLIVAQARASPSLGVPEPVLNVLSIVDDNHNGADRAWTTSLPVDPRGETAIVVERIQTQAVDDEDYAGTREDSKTMGSLHGQESNPMERQPEAGKLEWVQEAVNSTEHEVVSATVEPLVPSGRPDHVGGRGESNDKEDERHVHEAFIIAEPDVASKVDSRMAGGYEGSTSAELDALSTDTLPSEAELDIEAIVEKLDAEFVDRDDGDPDDVAFGEDASLLWQLASASGDLEATTPDSTVLAHDVAEPLHACIPTATIVPVTAPLVQQGDSIEAGFNGSVHYRAEEIAAVHASDGTYDISYRDGNEVHHVDGDLVALPITSSVRSSRAVVINEPSTDLRIQHPLTREYRVGDAVEAQYRGLRRYFPGEIAVVLGADRYDVRYADGEYETGVSTEFIRPLVEPRPQDLHFDAHDTNGKKAGVLTGRSNGVEAQTRRETEVVVPCEGPVEDTRGDSWGMPKCLVVEPSVTLPVGKLDLVILHRREDCPDSLAKSAKTVHSVDECKPSNQTDAPPQIERALSRQDSSQMRILPHECTFPIHKPVPVTPLGAVESLPLENHTEEPNTLNVESTPVVPFKRPSKRTSHGNHQGTSEDLAIITTARALLRDSDHSAEENDPSDLSEDDDEAFALDRILDATARIHSASSKPKAVRTPQANRPVSSTHSHGPTKKKYPQAITKGVDHQPVVPVLSPSTLRYLSPQRNVPATARTPHPKPSSQPTTTNFTPRAGTPSKRGRTLSKTKEPTIDVSWRELEEWENVDLILNRKRRVVHNGRLGGSDVPWGEEFAAIQSLKRFAVQYPEVLREHIECQLADVARSDLFTGTRPATTHVVATAARDALLLIKDLAFLLRHRLAPFFDAILPAVLRAVFHSHKRFLCETAYEVLEALISHCSNRRLVVALLRQAQRFPRDDLRLVNLTCLYVEKCLSSISAVDVHELLTKSATSVLDAIADLLTCKSAACQSSLQKSLLMLQTAVGEDAMERWLVDHLVGNALAVVRRHLLLAESAAGGANKSPSASPKKLSQQQQQQQRQSNGGTPAKRAAVNASGGGGILQRMLAQRQNRVVPSPE